MTSKIVKVAALRKAYDHMHRIANVDYHACVDEQELESWKRVAVRWLEEYAGYNSSRTTKYDLEQHTLAASQLRDQLKAADARIAVYRQNTRSKRAAKAPAPTMLH